MLDAAEPIAGGTEAGDALPVYACRMATGCGGADTAAGTCEVLWQQWSP